MQLVPASGVSFAGTSPYPGIANLGNTCYFNAPLHCLLHCGAARAQLGLLEPGPQGPDASFLLELRRFVKQFSRGEDLEGFESPVMYDVLAPHDLLDAWEALCKERVLYAKQQTKTQNGAREKR